MSTILINPHCLQQLTPVPHHPRLHHNPPCHVIIPGGLCGRLDHTLQALNIALTMQPEVCSSLSACGLLVSSLPSSVSRALQLRISFWNDDNSVEILPPGSSRLELSPDHEGPHCGLLPLVGRALVKTVGLQWELEPTDALAMEWGGLLSTSNRVTGERLDVDSNLPLLWTIERRKAP